SAEIMVISLNEVADEPFVSRALILVLVALAITAGVYGVVGLIVKMDDVGLRLARSRAGVAATIGRVLVRAMPVAMSVLSEVWVGGHIILVGLDELGASFLYEAVHRLETQAVDAAGGAVAWLANTAASALLGLIVGAAAVAVMLARPGAARH